MDFSQALLNLKSGKKVAQSGWNGKGMFLQCQFPDEHSKMGNPYIYIKGTDGKFTPWNPSQLDLFSMKWVIVD